MNTVGITLHRGTVTVSCLQNPAIAKHRREIARREYAGYLFDYEGRTYGVHQPTRHDDWRVTDIASGMAICFDSTRKRAIDRFVSFYFERTMTAISCDWYPAQVAEFEAAAPYLTNEQVIENMYAAAVA